MNKKLIQNILYVGHCLGICSDWSEEAVNDIIDKLKDDDFVYNKDIIDEDKLEELATLYMIKTYGANVKSRSQCSSSTFDKFDSFKAGYRKAKEE